MKIIGEEDPNSYSHIDPTLRENSLIEDLIPESAIEWFIHERKEFIVAQIGSEYIENPLDISIQNSSAFIDPLDGTKDFVFGYP